LLDSIKARHNKPVVLSISTHFHEDRTAGVAYYNKLGIKTYSSCQTRELCIQRKEKVPAYCFQKDTVFTLGGYQIETFYPGPGHAPDNITVWFPHLKALYGGCLFKSTVNTDLGNLADASVPAWGNTLRKVHKRYKNPRFIIPGHFDRDGNGIKHTVRLIRMAMVAK
jgi:metallo-beta-lactamase class B